MQGVTKTDRQTLSEDKHFFVRFSLDSLNDFQFTEMVKRTFLYIEAVDFAENVNNKKLCET